MNRNQRHYGHLTLFSGMGGLGQSISYRKTESAPSSGTEIHTYLSISLKLTFLTEVQ